jgi:hypothetical protein
VFDCLVHWVDLLPNDIESFDAMMTSDQQDDAQHPMFFHTGNPYVWLDYECPSYKPVSLWPYEALEPVEWENVPSYRAMLDWTSWMYN